LQGVRDASPEAIAALPGFGQKTAERVLESLQKNSPTAPAAAGSVSAPSDTSPSTDLS
jgi:Holliday junction resolvasome RuvABC DNA-binding subunit